jgi:hypothetical protein
MFLSRLSAGPDPSTMTCDAIKKGYELNAKLATTRAGAQHKANSQARVQELDPYYKACGFSTSGVTPTQPVQLPGTTTGAEAKQTAGAGVPGAAPAGVMQSSFGTAPAVDWKMLAMIVGGGVVLLTVLSILKKKGRSGAAPVPAGLKPPSMKDVTAVKLPKA